MLNFHFHKLIHNGNDTIKEVFSQISKDFLNQFVRGESAEPEYSGFITSPFPSVIGVKGH